MNRFASTFVLSLVSLGLAACGAEPGAEAEARSSGTATAPAPVTPPETAPEAPPAAAPARAEGTDPGELIPAFVAEGTTGEAARTIDSQEPGAVTVYCVGSTKCPFTNKYAARMREIETAYAGKDVQFVWLYSNRTEKDAEKAEWHAEKGLAGTFVIDRDAKIAKTLEFKRTPELIVTAADGTITYRGAFDDGKGNPAKAEVQWLSDAIDATLAGQPVAVEKTVPAG